MVVTRTEPTQGSHEYLTPANGMTVLRMAATPLMLGLIAGRHFDAPTFGLWIVLCGTDGIDGVLARRYGVTRSGAFLDPLADKFLILGAMIVLAVKGAFVWPLVLLIGVREVGMSIYRSVAGSHGISIPARKSAKAKTVVQQFAVAAAIAPWLGHKASWIGSIVLVVATILTVVSGAQYYFDARKR